MRSRYGVAVAAVIAIGLGGCAAADKNAADTTGASSNTGAGMNMSGSSGSGGAGSVAGTGSGSGMNMSDMKSTTVENANGVPTPVPVKTIGSGYWKDMKITAQEMTPVPFYVDNGTSYSKHTPPKNTSFHLMVMLTDRQTGVAIPYASVWAYIYKHGKLIFNQPQWAMLSRWMGPHYGNNVSLPGAGTYTLKVQVSAPKAAMHVEYANQWKGVHTITSTFTWPTSTG